MVLFGANGRPVLVGCGGCTATALLRPARASFGLKPTLTASRLSGLQMGWKLYWWEDYVRNGCCLSIVFSWRYSRTGGVIPEERK